MVYTAKFHSNGQTNRAYLYHNDNRVILQRMIDRGIMVDSIATDPPYGLTSITKRFGGKNAAKAKHGNDGSFVRLSKGFANQQWDATGIENDPEFWNLCLQVLKPGGYVIAFSSSRTYHKMATAMEQAGFIVHPMIGWVFSSGMAKAASAARAIDQALGKKGYYGEYKRGFENIASKAHKDGEWGNSKHDAWKRPWMKDPKAVDKSCREYLPATPEAEDFNGWYYGGQARNPAMEPIFVGQRPFSEKNGGLNILKHGVGAVNIDGCRIPDEADPNNKGRWPKNLIHDNSDEVVRLFPTSKSGSPVSGKEKSYTGSSKSTGYGKFDRVPYSRNTSNGSAARYFESYPFENDPIFYCRKPTKKEKVGTSHPTVKPEALMRSLIRHITPIGGVVLDPFAGSGTTGSAALLEGCDVVLLEQSAEYVEDIKLRLSNCTK